MKNVNPMKNLVLKSLLCLTICISGTKLHANPDIPILRFEDLEPLLHKTNDTIYIVNFWATWCVPCRKELPEFEKINVDYQKERVKIILVSLDFVDQIEQSLKPFLNKNRIHSDVVLLNDPNSNNWINRVDSAWSGSLPATLFYNKSNRYFVEDELNYDKIKIQIDKLSNN